MEGYRSLESGDLRVSESGTFRTTEGFNLGEVSLTAVGSKLTTSVYGSQGLVIGEATSSCVVVGTEIAKGIANLAGAGTAQSQAEVFLIVSSSLSGVGSQGSSARAVRAAVAPLSGSSVLAPTSLKIKYASYSSYGVEVDERVTEAGDTRVIENGDVRVIRRLDLTQIGSGSVAVTARRIRYSNYINYSEEATRITQSGDTRITEDGNVRQTHKLVYNQAEATLVATGLFTKFFSVAYIKVLGVWRQVAPVANYEGIWKIPKSIYKNINKNWKRIY